MTEKLLIRNLKAPLSPGLRVNQEMSKLEMAITRIYRKLDIQESYEELHRSVENLCTFRMSEALFENLKDIVQSYLESKIDVLQKTDFFLDALNNVWIDYSQQSNLVNNIYLYLDRKYMNDRYNRNSVWSMCLNTFKTEIVLHNEMKEKIVSSLLEQIALERNGYTIQKALIKSIIQMLIDLQIYDEIFNQHLLTITDNLYKTESNKYIRNFNISMYISYVNRRLEEETARVKSYLHKVTEKPLLEIVKNRLLKKHLNYILENGLPELLIHNKTNDLTHLYSLLNQISTGHSALSKVLNVYLVKHGRLIVEDVNLDKVMIENLLKFKDQIDDIVSNCFNNSPMLVEGVKSSFKYFINERQNKPAELLAKYIDSQLRSKNTEEDIEKLLNKCMVIFRFIQGMCINFYFQVYMHLQFCSIVS